MNIFIDTAAFLAVLNSEDRYHQLARNAWTEIINDGSTLLTSNYVILETNALLQHRFGMDAVRLFAGDILPIIDIIWVDQSLHQQAMSALLAANRHDLSLVDCISFEVMRQKGLEKVFTFDRHFSEQSFEVIP
jgi:predicted nucleic acid-binding protein